METLEQYHARVRSGVSLTTALKRTIIVDPDGETTIVEDYNHTTVVEEGRAYILLRDLGTLTPYRELGRGKNMKAAS
jgi:hypothetical protein